MQVESKLQALGLVLPEAPKVPQGFQFSFAWTRVRGNRIYLSGHGAQAPDGSFIGPFGKVPSEVSLEEVQKAALNTALSMIASSQARARRPGSDDGLANSTWDGQRRAWLSTDH
jgi:hypothetical protein